MMIRLKKLVPILLLLSVLMYVIYFTEPPKNLNEASVIQLSSLLIPLLLLITYLSQFFFKNWFKSLAVGLVITAALYLQGTTNLNWLTGVSLLIILIITPILKKRQPPPTNKRFIQTSPLKKLS